MSKDQNEFIVVEGARQNNLKGISLKLPLKKLIVVTGVSGSGKSSFAFDTVYAEGQRRYVETFSSYARQFLDRMDRPAVDRIEGIPPAIAIDQTNPVRTSRSTVGTMTELNDHLKILFSRSSSLFCKECGRQVVRDTPQTITTELLALSKGAGFQAIITFKTAIPENFTRDEIIGFLSGQGYTRIFKEDKTSIEVIQDRLNINLENRGRIVEDLEAGLKFGNSIVTVYKVNQNSDIIDSYLFSGGLHCPDCDLQYKDATSGLFSFNSPVGACETCRGFGRVIGVDYDLVIPDHEKSLANGAVKPWQTKSYSECQDDLVKFAKPRNIPINKPWKDLTDKQKNWVIEGEGSWDEGKWYGVKRFFEWLESRSYKMHIRVLLSRYRAYHLCPSCNGARLKPEALNWRIAGCNLHDIMLMPIDKCYNFFTTLKNEGNLGEAADLVLKEICTRLSYLVEVGLGYLTLDRQSRTLSGGEVQRINLTTALGTSLVNSLFVLDEPSIGLHSRDIGRLITVLLRLRDAGNTLLVVEHDPEVIRAADYVLDMGPGPGELGGEVVCFDDLKGLLQSDKSLTASYLCGRKNVCEVSSVKTDDKGPCIHIHGAREHNLKNIDVKLPLNRLVCITGVSGSGKSTLLNDVLYSALKKLKGNGKETPGDHDFITGSELIDDVVMVDQSPIGKTTRSNPVSYIGAFDSIRKLFAKAPLAQERGYTAGTFSFNSGQGRCPACSGSGFEHVEMQFLSDVYLRCPDCNGKRFRPEILEIKVSGKTVDRTDDRSISDVLDMTIDEAFLFFDNSNEIKRGLEHLRSVGLSYMKLGQPLPTLSGGEAQRLKLAGHLTQSSSSKQVKGTLFIFDEPTTGLHFSDIEVLMKAFRRLIDAGHSVVIIEHNLDVIRGADWIIDIGPEGGEAGGEIIFNGTSSQITKCKESHTGRALRNYSTVVTPGKVKNSASSQGDSALHNNSIIIKKAREHNLADVDITLPRNSFSVITGVSGSGKSTIAFDIIFAEGQRRYLESLNAYARQFVQPSSRPDVDGVFGIPPTVAIEQRTSRGGRKSTVATVTEIYHFMRLLYVKLGIQHCPDCNLPIAPLSPEGILAEVMKTCSGSKVQFIAPLVVNRKGYYTDLAKWASGKGFESLIVNGTETPTQAWPRLDRYKEHTIELPTGECKITPEKENEIFNLINSALSYGKGTISISFTRGKKAEKRIFSISRTCPGCGKGFEEPDPRLFSFNSRHGWCPHCYGTGLELTGFDENQTGEEIWWNQWWEGDERVCRHCNGQRLNREALAVRFKGISISEMSAMTVENGCKYFASLKLSDREKQIAKDIISELLSRFQFLNEVGLGYITLDRSAPTLSGGEAQRIRLAAQLGSNLRGVCYILDEPTIGLHPRDNARLLETLFSLKNRGNTIVVVEHDEDTIRSAEYLLDLGPGGGKNGGEVIARGTLKDVLKNPKSITGRYLKKPLTHHPAGRRPVDENADWLSIRSANLHNLKNIDAAIPLGKFVCVTGVSGSGKSSLVRDVLYENVKRLLAEGNKERNARYTGCEDITGWEKLERILEVDQSPIGKTPRSCPATYIGFWDDIRKIFACTQEAIIRGFTASRFSFNTEGGRCRECEGQGIKKIEMNFLPDVNVPCDGCNGARFTPETMEVKFKDKTISEVLAMSVDEAVEFFAAHQSIHKPLLLLQETGLGYLSLGQQSPTLSGGEAQRIKLVTELRKSFSKRKETLKNISTLYVLDEPTVGLHISDVEKLLLVLHKLVDQGNTVVVIEHNLDMIAEADWIIDLGPEGGDEGGRIVQTGTPAQLMKNRNSHTGIFLKSFLNTRGLSD
jgi:excinuclease ABC subunit A